MVKHTALMECMITRGWRALLCCLLGLALAWTFEPSFVKLCSPPVKLFILCYVWNSTALATALAQPLYPFIVPSLFCFLYETMGCLDTYRDTLYW